MSPFTEEQLEAAYLGWHQQNPRLAEMLLILACTSLRSSEARAVRVEDLMRMPTSGLVVRRAAPEGVGVKSTKRRRSRRVPLANRVLPLVLAMTEGKEPGDLLFTPQGGAQLHRTSVLRALDWSTTGQADESTTSATPRRACGWATSSSPRPTCTCTSSAPVPIEPAWIGSTCRGGPPRAG
jgi:integrase